MNTHELTLDGGAEHGRVTIQVCELDDTGNSRQYEMEPSHLSGAALAGTQRPHEHLSCAAFAGMPRPHEHLSCAAFAGMPRPDEIARRQEQERLFTPPMGYSEIYSSLRPEPRPLMPAEPKQKTITEINVYRPRNCQFGPENGKQYNISPNINIPLDLHIPRMLKAAVLLLWHRLFR